MREQYRIIKACLTELGLPYRLCSGGKHRRYEIDVDGSVIVVPVAGSPRDRHTAGKNTTRQIEKAVLLAKGRVEKEASGA